MADVYCLDHHFSKSLQWANQQRGLVKTRRRCDEWFTSEAAPLARHNNISRLLMIFLSDPRLGGSLRDKTREFSIFFFFLTGPVLVQLRCSSRYFCVWYSPNVGLSLASRTLQINVRFRRLCVLGSNKRLARLPELFVNELVVQW